MRKLVILCQNLFKIMKSKVTFLNIENKKIVIVKVNKLYNYIIKKQKHIIIAKIYFV